MADNHNDAAATKLVEALLPKLQEALMGKVNETLAAAEKAIGDRMDGLADKNAELLGKLHKSKDGSKTLEEQVAELTAQIAAQGKPSEIVISKFDARDRQKYLAASKQAKELGVPLRIDREAS